VAAWVEKAMKILLRQRDRELPPLEVRMDTAVSQNADAVRTNNQVVRELIGAVVVRVRDTKELAT